MLFFLLFAIVVFAGGYAVVTQYKNTEGSVAHRIVASFGLAAAALVALVTTWLHTWTTSP
jgi:hypothetical protein